jgi:hypothetical protein
MKEFRLPREGAVLTFRGDAFNIFNHAQFNNPNMTASGGSFGTVTTSAPGRNMQLSLKLVF